MLRTPNAGQNRQQAWLPRKINSLLMPIKFNTEQLLHYENTPFITKCGQKKSNQPRDHSSGQDKVAIFQ